MKMFILMSFLFTFLSFDCALAAPEIKLKNFETDYCTMFLDGPTDQPGLWKHCCLEHDLRYWFGGAQNDMDKSDLKLMACVTKAGGENWGKLIYYGVRAGHHSPIKNKYQWSWGWETKRQNNQLTTEETNYILSELKKINLPEINMGEFIRDNLGLSK
jgi:hypothetical protein